MLRVHRNGSNPAIAALSLLAVTLAYTGCRSESLTEGEQAPAAYGVPRYHFEYCELELVEQQHDPSGGLASLSAVLRYWDVEIDEGELANKYPPPEDGAHSIRKLRRIASDEGLTAFALVMKEAPIDQVGEQLKNGRPVIVSVRLPDAGYAGIGESGDNLTTDRFAVVFGQSEAEFLVMDAREGVVRMSKPAFETIWSARNHAALICSAS